MNKLVGIILIALASVIYTGLPNKLRTEKNYLLLEKTFGEKIAARLVGKFEKDEVTLPEIPSINTDATNTEVYSRSEKQVNIAPDKKQKLDYIFIRELMLAVQQRKLEDSEAGNWMNVLSQGGSREGVYRAMILGDDYAGLENFDNSASDEVAAFAKDFLEKFVAQTVSLDALREMNFYSVKRLICEKALEVIDAYNSDENKSKWYAVLSAEVAREHGQAMLSKIRKNSSPSYHQEWAMAVPAQHLKSETLIKLHRTFNHLQGN